MALSETDMPADRPGFCPARGATVCAEHCARARFASGRIGTQCAEYVRQGWVYVDWRDVDVWILDLLAKHEVAEENIGRTSPGSLTTWMEPVSVSDLSIGRSRIWKRDPYRDSNGREWYAIRYLDPEEFRNAG